MLNPGIFGFKIGHVTTYFYIAMSCLLICIPPMRCRMHQALVYIYMSRDCRGYKPFMY